MIPTKIASELHSLGYNSLCLPISTGLPHTEDSNDVINPNFKSAMENHLLCNYAIGLCTNGATCLSIDYNRGVIRFMKRGEEMQYASFDSLKRIVRDTSFTPPNDNVQILPSVSLPTPFLKISDMGLEPTNNSNAPDSRTSSRRNSFANLAEAVADSSSAHSNFQPELQDQIVRDSSDLQSSSDNMSISSAIKPNNKSSRDRTATLLATPTAGGKKDKIDSDEVKHLVLALFFKGHFPIKFLCSTVSQRDHIFNRFRYYIVFVVIYLF